MPHQTLVSRTEILPHITHVGDERFIAEITSGTRIGYKWFAFSPETRFAIRYRGNVSGVIKIYLQPEGEPVGEIKISANDSWSIGEVELNSTGVCELYLIYEGSGCLEIKDIIFS